MSRRQSLSGRRHSLSAAEVEVTILNSSDTLHAMRSDPSLGVLKERSDEEEAPGRGKNVHVARPEDDGRNDRNVSLSEKVLQEFVRAGQADTLELASLDDGSTSLGSHAVAMDDLSAAAGRDVEQGMSVRRRRRRSRVPNGANRPNGPNGTKMTNGGAKGPGSVDGSELRAGTATLRASGSSSGTLFGGVTLTDFKMARPLMYVTGWRWVSVDSARNEAPAHRCAIWTYRTLAFCLLVLAFAANILADDWNNVTYALGNVVFSFPPIVLYVSVVYMFRRRSIVDNMLSGLCREQPHYDLLERLVQRHFAVMWSVWLVCVIVTTGIRIWLSIVYEEASSTELAAVFGNGTSTSGLIGSEGDGASYQSALFYVVLVAQPFGWLVTVGGITLLSLEINLLQFIVTEFMIMFTDTKNRLDPRNAVRQYLNVGGLVGTSNRHWNTALSVGFTCWLSIKVLYIFAVAFTSSVIEQVSSLFLALVVLIMLAYMLVTIANLSSSGSTMLDRAIKAHVVNAFSTSPANVIARQKSIANLSGAAGLRRAFGAACNGSGEDDDNEGDDGCGCFEGGGSGGGDLGTGVFAAGGNQKRQRQRGGARASAAAAAAHVAALWDTEYNDDFNTLQIFAQGQTRHSSTEYRIAGMAITKEFNAKLPPIFLSITLIALRQFLSSLALPDVARDVVDSLN